MSTRRDSPDLSDDRSPSGGRKLFGRRRSHALRPGRRELLETLLPKIRVPLDFVERVAQKRDFRGLFEGVDRVWLEIGFGAGEHLIHQARTHPDVGVIGCEHYLDGVAACVSAVAAEDLSNIRLHPHDARDVLDAAPAQSLDRVFLLYPDPWPKTRHHKRRFVNAENLDLLAAATPRGAELRVASDVPDYIRHCLQETHAHGAFEWTAERSADWNAPWPDWPGTRYEAKAIAAGRRPAYLTFRRR